MTTYPDVREAKARRFYELDEDEQRRFLERLMRDLTQHDRHSGLSDKRIGETRPRGVLVSLLTLSALTFAVSVLVLAYTIYTLGRPPAAALIAIPMALIAYYIARSAYAEEHRRQLESDDRRREFDILLSEAFRRVR